MSIHIGLDIGAISLKLAALGGEKDRGRLADLAAAHPSFRLVDSARGPLLLSDYRRIAGSPIQSAYDILRELDDAIPEREIQGIRVTGSGSRAIARILGIYFENEFKAIARMLAAFYPEVRTIFEIGGENSKYIRLDDGIADYDRSGECAAGTGSFLDQQALRMGYAVEEVGELGLRGRVRRAHRRPLLGIRQVRHDPRPAERLHADRDPARALRRGGAQFQEQHREGASRECPGGVYRRRVAECRRVGGRCGKPSSSSADDLLVPELHAWCGAIGAALLEAADPKRRSFGEIHLLQQDDMHVRTFDTKPLSMDNVVLAARPRAAIPGAGRRRRPSPPISALTSAPSPRTWWPSTSREP